MLKQEPTISTHSYAANLVEYLYNGVYKTSYAILRIRISCNLKKVSHTSCPVAKNRIRSFTIFRR